MEALFRYGVDLWKQTVLVGGRWTRGVFLEGTLPHVRVRRVCWTNDNAETQTKRRERRRRHGNGLVYWSLSGGPASSESNESTHRIQGAMTVPRYAYIYVTTIGIYRSTLLLCVVSH
jgi:hypothetical protein